MYSLASRLLLYSYSCSVVLCFIFGIGGTSPGFANWTVGEAPFVGGWESILAIFMVAGFSFKVLELIGVAAGETEDPEKNVPKAINTIFWRILLFSILVLS